MNVVPASSVEVTPTVPPWAVTICCVMYRPSPMPLVFFVAPPCVR
jgi:hypothetical protein